MRATKPIRGRGWTLLVLTGALALVFPGRAPAYPPAPHHIIHGVVRDEMGNPFTTAAARVILETSSGTTVTSRVVPPDLNEGINYSLTIPMDSGLTSDLYRPTALRPTVPFKIKIQIGNVTYVPIEMAGDYALLGQAGKRTRIDLTLGEDSDGDGLPDAWERALIERLARELGLDGIRPGDDLDKDGLSNLAEYLAGTYADDSVQSFELKAVRASGGLAVLEFLTIAGRSYSVQTRDGSGPWMRARFRPVGGNSWLETFEATDTRALQVETGLPQDTGSARFFRLVLP